MDFYVHKDRHMTGRTVICNSQSLPHKNTRWKIREIFELFHTNTGSTEIHRSFISRYKSEVE